MYSLRLHLVSRFSPAHLSRNDKYCVLTRTVLLPLSPPVGGVEVGKIIAVFCKDYCLHLLWKGC